MLPAVKLDDELGGASYEIADEGANRDLPVEADSCQLSIPDVIPEFLLCICWAVAEFTRSLRG